MSADLTWLLIKDSNRFLVKREAAGRVQFSKEAGNLTNQNSFKWSGIANNKTIDLAPAENGATIAVKSVVSSNARRPAKTVNKTKLSGNFRKVSKAIKSQTAGNYYRGDLTAAALARWTRIHRSLKK
eukprot:GFYU01000122.1.p2 GENE.GFYU01000122.1~~GFYU01000122.1.p2  ORF type:complete len:127 (+),score=49.25 GFYU01000122.1:31-411(+)